MSENPELAVFATYLKEGSLEEALMAIEVLSQIDDPEARTLLIGALKNPLWQVRNALVEALIPIISEVEVPLLIEKMKSQSAKERNASRSIMNNRGDVVIPFLVKNLQSPDVDVRILSLNTLGMIKARGTINEILKVLDDPDQNVRESAIEALGELKAEREAELLTEKMKEREGDWDKIPYIVALGQIGDPYAIPTLLSLLDREILLLPVIEAIGKIADERGFLPLIPFLTHEDGDIVVQTLSALTSIMEETEANLSQENLPELLAWLQGEAKARVESLDVEAFFSRMLEVSDEDINRALSLNKWFHLPIPVSRLLPLLCREETNEKAEELLFSDGVVDIDLEKEILNPSKTLTGRLSLLRYHLFRGGLNRDFLCSLMVKGENELKEIAVQQGNKVLEAEDFPRLLELLEDSSNALLKGLAFLMGGRPLMEKSLQDLSLSPKEPLKLMALRALGVMRSPFIRDRANAFLNDPSPLVRAMALRSLGYFFCEHREELNEESLSTIASALNDEEQEVKEEAIVALGRIGDGRAVGYLLPLLDPTLDINFSLLIKTLSSFKALEVKENFQRFLQEGKEEGFIYSIIENIREQSCPDCFPFLVPYLDSSDDFLLAVLLDSFLNYPETLLRDVEERVFTLFNRTGDWLLMDKSLLILTKLGRADVQGKIESLLKSQAREIPDFFIATIIRSFQSLGVWSSNLVYAIMTERRSFLAALKAYMLTVAPRFEKEIFSVADTLRSNKEYRFFLALFREMGGGEVIERFKLILQNPSPTLRALAYLHLKEYARRKEDREMKEWLEGLEGEELDSLLLKPFLKSHETR